MYRLEYWASEDVCHLPWIHVIVILNGSLD